MIIGSDKRCTVAEKIDEDGELEVCIKSRDAIHIFEFIGEDDARMIDHGAGDGHALLLAAGEFVGTVSQPVGQSDVAQ